MAGSKAKVSEEALLEELRRVKEELGESPTVKQFRREGEYSCQTYRRRFGSWNEAKEKANLDAFRTEISDDDIIEDLKALRDQLGKIPSNPEYLTHGEYSPTTAENHFGSWQAALQAAFGKDTPTGYGRAAAAQRVPKEELKPALRSLADRVDGVPTQAQMDELGEYSSSTYIRRFGTWSSALEAVGLSRVKTITCDNCGEETEKPLSRLQGLDRSFCSRSCYFELVRESESRFEYDDEEILDEISNVADDLGETPTRKQFGEQSHIARGTVTNRFDTWNNALCKAGLDVNERKYAGKWVECSICSEEVYRKPTRMTSSEQHFCSLECKGEWQSQHIVGEAHPSWNGGKNRYYGENWHQQREARLEVDGYECQHCRMDNEEHFERFGAELHVHHIKPLREFEEPEDANTLDNLVTLCHSCHRKWEGIPLRPQAAD